MFSKSEFMKVNNGKKLNELDYLHAIYKFNDVHIDLVSSFSMLFNPKLELINGDLFIRDIFSIDKYDSFISEGKQIKEVQYWMNLIEITSIFENIELSKAQELAKSIEESWNNKISKLYPNSDINAFVINDQNTDEVFVTLSKLGK